MTRRLSTIALLALALSGCATVSKVSKVDGGPQSVGERLTVTLEGAWNHYTGPGSGPETTWTMDGLPVDRLMLYSGIKDGQIVHADSGASVRKSFSFRSGMQPDEIVAMFEGMFTRDGSTFKLVKLEPSSFGGLSGFRFEYALTRKVDNVQLAGIGYGAVSQGELFALLYQAPRLAFFPRHRPQVERIARSARIKA